MEILGFSFYSAVRTENNYFVKVLSIYISIQIIEESEWMDLSEMLQRLLEEEGD